MDYNEKKKNLTFIFRVLEGEEKGNADKKVFEKIMTKIFPVLAKSIKQHIQEFEQIPNRKTQRNSHQETL